MRGSEVGKARGILKSKATQGKFHHSRLKPSTGLAYFIEHFWIVRWSIEGAEPHVAETLPHPSVHLVIEESRSEILGVVTGKFRRTLHGSGRVFGIKFRPGAFYPFYGAPVSQITDRSLNVSAVFGADSLAFRDRLLAEQDERRCVEIAEEFLYGRLPDRDASVERIRDVVEAIAVDRAITRVEQVASMLSLSLRTSQRIFRKYIGVTPKWVIQRYRLHEAAEQLATDRATDLTELALQLGYFDQAHFAREFKKVVGRAPGEYARGL